MHSVHKVVCIHLGKSITYLWSPSGKRQRFRLFLIMPNSELWWGRIGWKIM